MPHDSDTPPGSETQGLHPRAAALSALLDTDLPLQPQHLRGRLGAAACGAAGQTAAGPEAVTCSECKALLAKRARKPGMKRCRHDYRDGDVCSKCDAGVRRAR